MLSIYGSKPGRSGYCDGVSRRGMLKIGALGVGAFGLNMVDLLRAEDAAATLQEPQGGYQYLPRWRTTSPGHVGNQDQGAEGNSWAFSADCDQCSRDSDRRVFSQDCIDHGQVDGLEGRRGLRGTARFVPVHDRLASPGNACGGRLPGPGQRVAQGGRSGG